MTNKKKNLSVQDRQVFYRKNRMFLYVVDKYKAMLKDYAKSDPRFSSTSKCAVYLINLGLKHDVKDRAKALEGVDK